MEVRRWIRRRVPVYARLGVARLRRRIRDAVSQPRFAVHHGDTVAFPHTWASYELPLFDYPGQEDMGRAKRHNQALVAALIHGIVVEPGETFSFWRLVGRPDAARGFLAATALKEGRLTAEVGGAVCFISTVIYNAALLAALTITERRAHSLDTYGNDRYFELGRDAAVEFGYLDLRFRNDHPTPVILLVGAEPGRVIVTVAAPVSREFDVTIAVSAPSVTRALTIIHEVTSLAAGAENVRHPGYDGVSTRTERVVRDRAGNMRIDDLGESIHHAVPRVIERGRASNPASVR